MQKPEPAHRTQSGTLEQSSFEPHGGPCCPDTHDAAGDGDGDDDGDGDGEGDGPGEGEGVGDASVVKVTRSTQSGWSMNGLRLPCTPCTCSFRSRSLSETGSD